MKTRQRNIRNRPVPRFSNYSFLALFLFSVIIILLDFAAATTTTNDNKRDAKQIKADLHGICVADPAELAKLQIGPAKRLDLKIAFPADTKSYSPHGYSVPITITVRKDRIDAMLIYAYGKGDDTLRVGSWDSTDEFNWDVLCGDTTEQNATLVTVGDDPVTSTTLTWYPPYSPGSGDISFKALVINTDIGHDIFTSGSLTESTNANATKSSTSTTTSFATTTSSTSGSSGGYIPTEVNTIYKNDAKSNGNLDPSFIIAIILMVSFPLINVIL